MAFGFPQIRIGKSIGSTIGPKSCANPSSRMRVELNDLASLTIDSWGVAYGTNAAVLARCSAHGHLRGPHVKEHVLVELIVCAMLAGALVCQLVSSFLVLTH